MVTDDAARELVDALIAEHARTGEPFSANQFRPRLADVPPGLISPRFARASGEGVIERIGSVPSSKPNTSGHHIALWRGTGVLGRAPVRAAPVSDAMRAKAARLLGAGSVTLLEVTRDGQVAAVVRTGVQAHRVTRTGGVWFCGCNPDDPTLCSHVLAVAMVTGGRP